MAEFDGKVVIVTGGALGIGGGTAKAFADEGASVTIADVDEAAGAALAAEIGPDCALFVPADVSRAEGCRRVVEATVTRFGGVDILFNNVGIQPASSYATVEDLAEEVWDRVLDVNLKSYFLMAKYAIPEIRRRGGGAVINNASVQGLQSMPRVPAYAASKGAVLSLTRQMALDYARQNIRVLAICPGTIETEMVRKAAVDEGGDLAAVLRRYGEPHPLGRIGQVSEVASLVLFLASDKASFMTGEHVAVDGGLMAVGAWATGTGANANRD